MIITTEEQFRGRIIAALRTEEFAGVKSVSGPGRSGAVAAVYASHILGCPFIPAGQDVPSHLRPHLVIDTAMKTGATLRKAARKVNAELTFVAYIETERRCFWYERPALGL